MSLENHLERLKTILSEQDLKQFEQLSHRLNSVGGDINQLTEQELDLISKMEEKYGDKIHNAAVENADEVITSTDSPESPVQVAADAKDDIVGVNAVVPDEFPLLKTEFASYVKDMLLRELGNSFPDLKSTVDHAFENKWIPQELKNQDVCETLFERFFSDIDRANQWRYEMQGQKPEGQSKTMAVGLTWFMYVFQLKLWLDKFPG